MKRWYNRKPETMQDWLLLFAVAAALLAAVWYLPAIAAALRVLLGLATPFAGGLALAYVLDIPARWFAIHLFGGRRGPGILLAYLALFGTVAALVGLVVPQLVQSVGSFAAALPFQENIQHTGGVNAAHGTAFQHKAKALAEWCICCHIFIHLVSS